MQKYDEEKQLYRETTVDSKKESNKNFYSWQLQPLASINI